MDQYIGVELTMETMDWSHFNELWSGGYTRSSSHMRKKKREIRMKANPDDRLILIDNFFV